LRIGCPGVKVTLYGIPGSHPVRAARMMLEYKGIPYRNVDLPPVLSRVVVPHLLRFPGNRVPAMKIDGRAVQGTLAVALELDRVRPDPPLLPSEPAQRSRVEDAERWADDFQQVPRTIIWWAFQRTPSSDQASFLTGAKLGLPTWLVVRTGAPIAYGARRLNDSYDPEVQRLLAELPAQLDHIDELIGEGVLNGERLYVADFDIAASLRLLMAMEDLWAAIESRPCGNLAVRVQPTPPGHIRPVYPQAWLEPLAAASRSA
jgi:glutathione S-transferase